MLKLESILFVLSGIELRLPFVVNGDPYRLEFGQNENGACGVEGYLDLLESLFDTVHWIMSNPIHVT